MLKHFLYFFIFLSYATNALGDKLYLKSFFEINRLNPVKDKDYITKANLKQNSKFSNGHGIGIGYYLNDTTRADITFEYINFNFNKAVNNFIVFNKIKIEGTKSSNREANAKLLMFNVYTNLFDKNTFKTFVGIGSGVAQLKEKVTYSYSGLSQKNSFFHPFIGVKEAYGSKKKYNLIYSIILGAEIKLQDNVKLDLVYNWRNLGKIKYNESYISAKKYKGYNVNFGIRLDF